ncbi:hypothetical protein HDU85_005827 [Gaertneriomyces sp. JEL0708]|nr:hypothetical protein HDU85_005827 [Gaertneriomyces sp. JEL0708]
MYKHGTAFEDKMKDYMSTPQWEDFVQSARRTNGQHDSNDMLAEWHASVLVGKKLKRQCGELENDEQPGSDISSEISDRPSAINPLVRPVDVEYDGRSEVADRDEPCGSYSATKAWAEAVEPEAPPSDVDDIHADPTVGQATQHVTNNVLWPEPDDQTASSELGARIECGPRDWHTWILASGKDVRKTICAARAKIPRDMRAASLLWWGILDLSQIDHYLKDAFTSSEIEEMRKDFDADVSLEELPESDQQAIVEIFNDVRQKSLKIRLAWTTDSLTSWRHFIMEKIHTATISGETPPTILRRTIQNYAANVTRLVLPASEASVDNATTAFLLKNLIDPQQLRWHLEEGERQSLASGYARNMDKTNASTTTLPGQKVDLRLTLADTTDRVEALIHLRAGGLPRPGLKKFALDKCDLAECMMEILHHFMKENSGVDPAHIGKMFVLGSLAWDWSSNFYGLRWRCPGVFCMGLLKRCKLPHTVRGLPVLENAVNTIVALKATLTRLSQMVEDIAVAKACINTRERRKTLNQNYPYAQPPLAGCVARKRRKLSEPDEE